MHESLAVQNLGRLWVQSGRISLGARPGRHRAFASQQALNSHVFHVYRIPGDSGFTFVSSSLFARLSCDFLYRYWQKGQEVIRKDWGRNHLYVSQCLIPYLRSSLSCQYRERSKKFSVSHRIQDMMSQKCRYILLMADASPKAKLDASMLHLRLSWVRFHTVLMLLPRYGAASPMPAAPL